jgi:hypothetical protein
MILIIPTANRVNVNTPAIGRSASAAWSEVWMSVTPCAFNVAADDEEADQVRVAHPDVGIKANPPDLLRSLLWRREQWMRRRIDALPPMIARRSSTA